jgi:hypothetical protein
MSEGRPPILDIDWRYRVAATLAQDWLSPEGVVHEKGTPVTVATFVKHDEQRILIGDPSAPALFLSQSHKAFLQALQIHPFLNKPTADRKVSSTATYDYLELMMASVVFAYTAVEAFTNEEIPEDFVYEDQTDSGLLIPRQKEWIERHLSLDEKLAVVLPKAKGKPTPKGLSIWEEYVHLRRLRDRIIHMKSRDRARSKGNDLYPDSIWSELLDPKQRNYPLIAKNMLLHFRDKSRTHWLKYCPF